MKTLTSLLLFLFLFNLSAQAQNCPVILFEDITGAQGDTVVVDVYLSDFPSFLGLQGTINYDTEVLSFVNHIDGELLGPTFSFGTNEPVADTGQILISGSTFDGIPRQNYIEQNVLFSLVFVIIGEQGTSSDIIFDDSFIAIQLINNVGLVGFCDIINGSIETTAPAQSCPIITLENKVGVPGDTIVLDMYLSGITPLQGFQGTIVYDPTVLTFLSVEEGDAGSDFRLSANEPVLGSGEVLITGIQLNAVENNIYEQTAVLAKLIFVVGGASGSSSEIIFDGTGLDILFISDVQSGSDEAVCDIINGSISVNAQGQNCPTILIEDTIGVPGDTVSVDVYLSNISPILGFQGTISYDPSVLTFITHENGEAPDDFRLQSNEPVFEGGQVTILGLELGGNIIDIFDDPSVLIRLLFVVKEDFSTDTEIKFDGSLSEIEFISSIAEGQLDACEITNGTMSFQAPSPNDFEVSVVANNALCNQTMLGSISATGFFGAPPYTFVWTGPNGFFSTEQNVVDLLPGVYNLTATDSDGATVVVNDIEIQEVGGDYGIASSIQHNFCDSGMEGFIMTNTTFNNTGADLQFEWSTNENGENLTGLSNGLYFLTITDNSGCTQVHEYEINSSRTFMLDFDINPPCEGESTGFIYPSILSGQDLSFFWSNAAVTDSIENLAAGTYEVTIQEPQGCLQVRTVELGEIIENSTVVPTTLCSFQSLDNGLFLPAFAGDLEGTTVSLDLFNAIGDTASPSELGPGEYSYMITSINGCSYEGSFTMEESLTDYTEDYYSCLLDSIQMVTTSNNPDLVYSWSPDSSFVIDSIANPIFLDAEFANPNFNVTLLTSGAQGCTRSFNFNIIRQDACVWPGDTNEDNMVSALDLLHIGIANGDFGPARPMANVTDWSTQPASLWNENIGMTNLDKMFADCNGDGTINDEDILVVEQNNGLSHLGLTSESETDRAMGAPLFVDLLNNYSEGVEHEIEIVLGDMTDQALSAYGVAFQIEYDPNVSVLTPSSFQEQGWLSGDESTTWDIEFNDDEAGIADVALTRTNGIGLDGFGPIATFRSTFFGTQKSEIEFNIINAVLLTANATDIPVQGESSTSVIGTSSAHTLNSALYNESISPNPSSDFIVIRSDRTIDAYYIYNTMGQNCKQGVLSQSQIDIHELIPGMYTIQLEGTDGITAHKLIVK